MNLIIGGTGLIGSEIVRQFAIPEKNIINRNDYQKWWDKGLHNSIYRQLERLMPEGGNLFVASGLVNPSLSSSVLFKANFELPKNIIQAAHKLNIKTHTFGTIQEYFTTDNPYLSSKRRLATFLEENNFGLKNCHYRLHTLYGGTNPKEFMFLSKLSKSIQRQEPFLMSSGRQLREFHHVEDDVAILISLCQSEISGIVDINHGKDLQIGTFAHEVLKNYRLEGLLKKGFYADPDNENYAQRFPKIQIENPFEFRDPVSGFIDYQNSIMNS